MVKRLKTRSKRTKRGSKTQARKRKQTRKKIRKRTRARRGGMVHFTPGVSTKSYTDRKQQMAIAEKRERDTENIRRGIADRQKREQEARVKEQERIAKKPLNRMTSFFRSKFSGGGNQECRKMCRNYESLNDWCAGGGYCSRGRYIPY